MDTDFRIFYAFLRAVFGLFMDDRKEVEPISKALTKNEDRQVASQDVWDRIKTDIFMFLNSTSKVINFNKRQWLDLMPRNHDSTKDVQGCISKGQKKDASPLGPV